MHANKPHSPFLHAKNEAPHDNSATPRESPSPLRAPAPGAWHHAAKPAQRPWLAEGGSRSTYYQRRKPARERAGPGATLSEFPDRSAGAEAFVAALQADLPRPRGARR